jgi:hypothetical protein
MMHYIVMCRVSGGVTGTREAPLKHLGTLALFDTREAAQAKADELNRKMNHPSSVASFRYWVEAHR